MDRLTCKYDEQNALRELCSFGRKSDIEADDCFKCDEYCDMVVKECKDTDYPCGDKCAIQRAFDKLADYEDLEEKGLLLKLPCKVGDTVWHINEKITKQGRKKVIKFFVDNGEVDNIRLGSVMIPQITLCTSDNHWITFDLDEDWNKNIFLTKEEAEQELKRLECAE